MITFKLWLFIFCGLFEIKTFLLILQTFLTFATKHGADGALPGCITRYPRDQICIPLMYFRRITLVECHLQTIRSESRADQTHNYIKFSLLFKEFNFVCLLQYEWHSPVWFSLLTWNMRVKLKNP